MSHQLQIAAIPGNWRLFMVRRNDPGFLPFRDAIFRRDDYTCQFCGFKSQIGQEIANLDGNYANNKNPNLVTACCFCSQCSFLEMVGLGENSGGQLIYLPEMSQTDLNGLCHALFCTVSDPKNGKEAKEIYLALKERNTVIEQCLGVGMSSPTIFGRLLINLTTERRKKVVEKIFPFVRLLPTQHSFESLINLWQEEAFRGFVQQEDVE